VSDDLGPRVLIRGVNVLVSQLRLVREVLAEFADAVASGKTLEAVEGSRTEAAMEFMAQATKAGHPTRPSDLPDVLAEIDAAINAAGDD
jgi:hypothetical protein